MSVRKWFSNNPEERALLRIETTLKLELLKDMNIAEQQINDRQGIRHSHARARMLEHFETVNHKQQVPQRSYP
jgi:hypothetical protein